MDERGMKTDGEKTGIVLGLLKGTHREDREHRELTGSARERAEKTGSIGNKEDTTLGRRNDIGNARELVPS